MDVYELRKTTAGAYTLSGGRLDKPLQYAATEYAIRMVGFLAQLNGAELQLYDEIGKLIETRSFPAAMRPTKSELGNV